MKHVLGDKKTAYLPSRGCTTKPMALDRWWVDTYWHQDSDEYMNCMDSYNQSYDEEEIQKGKLKSVYILTNSDIWSDSNWFYRYFLRYERSYV